LITLVAWFFTSNVSSLGFCSFTCLWNIFLTFEKWCSDRIFRIFVVLFQLSLYLFIGYWLNIFLFCISAMIPLMDKFLFKNLLLVYKLFILFQINLRMISLLHPSMTFVAFHPRFTTSLLNWFDFIWKYPILTFFCQIFEILGPPPKILYIVCVNTIASIMSE